MATKKIPISFNDEDQAELQELIQKMGITNTYGDLPKAVKFGIRLALSAIKNPQKVYAYLDEDNLDIYLSSVLRSEKQKRLLRKSKKLAKKAESV